MNLSALLRGAPITVAPGIHSDVRREQYDRIEAISATVLKKYLQLGPIPSKFAYWLRTRWDEPVSEPLLLGSALDCLLLERDQFEKKFAVVPADAPPKPSSRQRNAKKPSPETQAACIWWDRFNKDNTNKAVLTAAQFETVGQMRFALQVAPKLQGVFQHCRKVVLVGELFGLPAKCEIDLWNPQIKHILDLKTAGDVLPASFTDAARKFGYIESATFYLLLANVCGFGSKAIFSFVAVESSAPWTVEVYSFDPFGDPDHRVLFDGTAARLERAAQELARRLDTNDFTDDENWKLLRFPEWTVRQAKMESLLTV